MLPGLRILLLLALLFFGALTASGQDRSPQPVHSLRLGFASELMQGVGENDARAAMKVWAESLTKDGSVRAASDSLVCPGLECLTEALKAGTVDAVVVPTTTFLKLRSEVAFNRCVFGTIQGTVSDEYALVVRADSGFSKIEDLRGRALFLWEHYRMCLATAWLDTLLLEKGQKAVCEHFSLVTKQSKLTKAVLPVFFCKADACLVTRKGFQTMSELNPQVGQQLRVLTGSPGFVPSGFFFRAGYPQSEQDSFVTELTRVHKKPSGQQILTVFQTERLEEHPASVLESAAKLLETHQKLLGGSNRSEVAAKGNGLGTGKRAEK